MTLVPNRPNSICVVDRLFQEHGYGLVPSDYHDNRYSIYSLGNAFSFLGELHDTSCFPEEESYHITLYKKNDDLADVITTHVNKYGAHVEITLAKPEPKEIVSHSLETIVEYTPSSWEVVSEVVKDIGSSVLRYSKEKGESTLLKTGNILYGTGFILKAGFYGAIAPYTFNYALKKTDDLLEPFHVGSPMELGIVLTGGITGFISAISICLIIGDHPIYALFPLMTNIGPSKMAEVFKNGYKNVQKRFHEKRQKIIEDNKKKNGLIETTEIALLSGLCPVCGGETKNITLCHSCNTPHCTDCWNYNGGCGIFACSQRDVAPIKNASTSLPDYIPPESQRLIERMYRPWERDLLARCLRELKEKK